MLKELLQLLESKANSTDINIFHEQLMNFFANILKKQKDKKYPKETNQPNKSHKWDKDKIKERELPNRIKKESNRISIILWPHELNSFMETGDGSAKVMNIVSKQTLKLFFDLISKFAKLHHWSISNISDSDFDDSKILHFSLYPDKNPTLLVSDLPEKLYHITTSDKVDSILKRGILPMTSGIESTKHETEMGSIIGTYKNKLFVFNKYDKSLMKNAFENLFKTGTMSIIEIDVSKLPKSIKFYKDLTVFDDDDDDFHGYWTKTPIPSDAVSIKDKK